MTDTTSASSEPFLVQIARASLEEARKAARDESPGLKEETIEYLARAAGIQAFAEWLSRVVPLALDEFFEEDHLLIIGAIAPPASPSVEADLERLNAVDSK